MTQCTGARLGSPSGDEGYAVAQAVAATACVTQSVLRFWGFARRASEAIARNNAQEDAAWGHFGTTWRPTASNGPCADS